jgi:hypothetical protein
MAEKLDRLSAALREIAGADALESPRRFDARIAGELRALRKKGDAAPGRWLGLATAAALTVAILGGIAVATRAPRRAVRPSASVNGEVTTAFLPLAYSNVPYTDAQLVRIDVPREALRNFGLAPSDIPFDQMPPNRPATIVADVLVGEDGLARAVRFVRPERKDGVTQ